MADEDSHSLTGGLAEQLRHIEPKLAEVKKNISSTELVVIVFGPGKLDRLHRKREQIREELNKIPGVSAFFPEDRGFKSLVLSGFGLPESEALALEAIQASIADVIIALEPGYGVKEEVALFANHGVFSLKLYDLLPDEYRETSESSFSGQMRRNIQKYYYKPDEISSCHVATEVCPRHVRTQQVLKTYFPRSSS